MLITKTSKIIPLNHEEIVVAIGIIIKPTFEKNVKLIAIFKITEIKELQSKSLESICSSSGNIIAAIEMNEGWFKENSIEPGVEVFLP